MTTDELAARLGAAYSAAPREGEIDLATVHRRADSRRRRRTAITAAAAVVLLAGGAGAAATLADGHATTLRQQPGGNPGATLSADCRQSDLKPIASSADAHGGSTQLVFRYAATRSCDTGTPRTLIVRQGGAVTSAGIDHAQPLIHAVAGGIFTITVTVDTACRTAHLEGGATGSFVLDDGSGARIAVPDGAAIGGVTACRLSGESTATTTTIPSTPVVTPCGTGDLIVQASSVKAFAEVTTIHIDYLATRACSDSAPWKLEVRTPAGASDAALTQTTEVRHTADRMLESFEMSVPTTCRTAHLADPGTAALYTESGARIDLPASLQAAGLVACHPTGAAGDDAPGPTAPAMAATPPAAPTGATDPAETDDAPGAVTTITGSLGADGPFRVVVDGTRLTATFGNGRAPATGTLAPTPARLAGVSDLFSTGEGLILVATGDPCGRYRCTPSTFDVYQVDGTAIRPLLLTDGSPFTLATTAASSGFAAFRCREGRVQISTANAGHGGYATYLDPVDRLTGADRVESLTVPGPGPGETDASGAKAYGEVDCPGLDSQGYSALSTPASSPPP